MPEYVRTDRVLSGGGQVWCGVVVGGGGGGVCSPGHAGGGTEYDISAAAADAAAESAWRCLLHGRGHDSRRAGGGSTGTVRGSRAATAGCGISAGCTPNLPSISGLKILGVLR
jgi:hypothetical protein